VKTLLVSGCSWTDPNFESVHHPEMDTSWKKWPEILAEKLELNLVNVAWSGSGNQYIYTSLLDKIVELDVNDIALVIAGWSKGCRSDFEQDGRRKNIMHDNRGDVDYFIKRNLRYFYSLQTVCAYHNLPLKQFHMLHPFNNPGVNKLDGIKSSLSNHYQDKLNFMGYSGEPQIGGWTMSDLIQQSDFISEIDRHPNKKGQEKIAGILHENI
jgi:hypothetical protein|tara:strand:+ start:4764 stop:5396 length:633 start_codon:yes stop_codon:yes gene_type:complete